MLIQYAIYKGDEFIMLGTTRKCTKQLNVSEDYIAWMASPTCSKRNKGNRMIAIRLKEEVSQEATTSHKGGNQMTPNTKDVNIQEERRTDLKKRMDDNHIKGTALSAVTHISSAMISLFRIGKSPISDKNWKIIQEGITKILEETTGISEKKVVKLKPVVSPEDAALDLLPSDKPIDVPEYLLQFLQDKGNAVISKRFGGHDIKALDAYLKAKGFECTLSENRDHDWMAVLIMPTHKHVEFAPLVEKKQISPVIAPCSAWETGTALSTASLEPAKENTSVENQPIKSIIAESEIVAYTFDRLPAQVAYLKESIERHQLGIENADALAMVETSDQLKRSKSILESILAALEDSAQPKKDINAHVEKTVNFLKSVEDIGLQLIEAVHVYVGPEKEPSDEPK